MREHEAAAHLGVSVRTLYRYRKAGKVAFRVVKGRGRPVIEYDRAEVERLKRTLAERAESASGPAPEPPRRPRVTFGLSPSEHAELSRDAARYGMTPGEYARQLAREGMESRFRTEAAELRQELDTLQGELRKVRSEVASAFEVVLEYVGLAPEAARQWVTENLR
jgi:hypothetical protein